MGRRVTAVDIGASSGKMAFGEYDGRRLITREYRDFANRPADIGTALYWDVFSLYHAVIDGMAYFNSQYGEADTIAIDTWGASYGLLDKEDRLLEPVYHYRDERTRHVIRDMDKVMDTYELFQLTGCQCNRTYTLPQLYSYRTAGSPVLDNAESMLLLPDLLGYFLSGVKTTEMTIAGTSCLMENRQEDWSLEVAERFSIPKKIYTEIVEPGTFKGRLRNPIQAQTGMRNTKLAAIVAHDSAQAVAAIPDFGEGKLYISIGTNVSMGIERSDCLLTEAAYRKGFKNTGGIDRSKIVYRDFSACWHLNEFIRTKKTQGVSYTHPQLIQLAKEAKQDIPWFDVEAPEFNDAGGDFCEKMNQYFERTGQRKLHSDGEFARSIFESIALKVCHYARALKELGISYQEVYVINGAVRNELLMQLISNALGCEIRAGMPYATLAGNLLTQLYALGEVKTVKEMRSLSKDSFEMNRYEPEDRCYWIAAIEKYAELSGGCMEKGYL
ncbi:FGGY family carbohydrate kinase [Blautia schinkii]|nr:FGGY family carbohydrate kinase [Blautia schinkii]